MACPFRIQALSESTLAHLGISLVRLALGQLHLHTYTCTEMYKRSTGTYLAYTAKSACPNCTCAVHTAAHMQHTHGTCADSIHVICTHVAHVHAACENNVCSMLRHCTQAYAARKHDSCKAQGTHHQGEPLSLHHGRQHPVAGRECRKHGHGEREALVRSRSQQHSILLLLVAVVCAHTHQGHQSGDELVVAVSALRIALLLLSGGLLREQRESQEEPTSLGGKEKEFSGLVNLKSLNKPGVCGRKKT